MNARFCLGNSQILLLIFGCGFLWHLISATSSAASLSITLPVEQLTQPESTENLVPVFHAVHDGFEIWRPLTVSEGHLLVIEFQVPFTCTEPRVQWQNKIFSAMRIQDRWQTLLPVPFKSRHKSHPTTLVIQCDAAQTSFSLSIQPLYPQIESACRPISNGRILKVKKKYTQKSPRRVRKESYAIVKSFRDSFSDRLWTKAFIRPAAGPETSPFGKERYFNGVLKSMHQGLDLDGTSFDPVYAANDGRVVLVGKHYYYPGNLVIIDHGEKLFTLYMHLSRIFVKPKQKLKRGQLLGTIGATGRATGPHLHFGVKYAGLYIDPVSLLGFRPNQNLPFALRAPMKRPTRLPPMYADLKCAKP